MITLLTKFWKVKSVSVSRVPVLHCYVKQGTSVGPLHLPSLLWQSRDCDVTSGLEAAVDMAGGYIHMCRHFMVQNLWSANYLRNFW